MCKGKKELKTVLFVSRTDDTNRFMSTNPVTGETIRLESTVMKTWDKPAVNKMAPAVIHPDGHNRERANVRSRTKGNKAKN